MCSHFPNNFSRGTVQKFRAILVCRGTPFENSCSTLTNLHIFLSFYHSFLSVAGWWLSCCYGCFLSPQKVNSLHTSSGLSCFLSSEPRKKNKKRVQSFSDTVYWMAVLPNFMLYCYIGKYEELHCMQSAAPPYLALLLVRGLSTILLVGGLGVEDNRMALVNSQTYCMWFRIVALGQRRILSI
jgi:hypothetical protein